MKTVMIFCIIAFALSCGKSSDPKAATGCNFTFKGKNYSIATAGCDKGTISAYNGTWLITMIPSDGSIGFDDGTSTTSTYVATTTLIKNGSTVSFNTTVTNNDGDSGVISGKCTCSVGTL